MLFEDEDRINKVTAIELKTGRWSPSHNRQLMLYIMILKEVFRDTNSDHLLVYITSEHKNKAVQMIDQEAMKLIHNRNILCRYKINSQRGSYELPPMLLDDVTWGKWFSRDLCSTMALSFNKYWINNEKPKFNHFENADGKLDNDVRDYFKTWIERINKENFEFDQQSSKVIENHIKEDSTDIEEQKESHSSQNELIELKETNIVESNLKMTSTKRNFSGFIVHKLIIKIFHLIIILF